MCIIFVKEINFNTIMVKKEINFNTIMVKKEKITPLSNDEKELI